MSNGQQETNSNKLTTINGRLGSIKQLTSKMGKPMFRLSIATKKAGETIWVNCLLMGRFATWSFEIGEFLRLTGDMQTINYKGKQYKRLVLRSWKEQTELAAPDHHISRSKNVTDLTLVVGTASYIRKVGNNLYFTAYDNLPELNGESPVLYNVTLLNVDRNFTHRTISSILQGAELCVSGVKNTSKYKGKTKNELLVFTDNRIKVIHSPKDNDVNITIPEEALLMTAKKIDKALAATKSKNSIVRKIGPSIRSFVACTTPEKKVRQMCAEAMTKIIAGNEVTEVLAILYTDVALLRHAQLQNLSPEEAINLRMKQFANNKA